MTVITSRQNPIVARYKAAAHRDEDDVLLLDGVHLVTDALAAGVRIEHAAMTDAARADPDMQELLAKLARAGVEVAFTTTAVMDAISPVRSSSAVAALAKPPTMTGDEMYSGAHTLVVVAADVQDPGNAGAIVRVAEAGGATGVIASGGTADLFGWKALRGSMGSTLRLPVVSGVDPTDAIADAKRHGCRVIAAAPRGGRSPFDIDLTGPVAILIGGEGRGLAPALVDAADERVTIPMQAPVESLNAAVTAALLVYEARRQRSATKTRRHEA